MVTGHDNNGGSVWSDGSRFGVKKNILMMELGDFVELMESNSISLLSPCTTTT